MKRKFVTMLSSVFLYFIMGLIGAVLAYFTITAVSQNNTFETGSMSLVLTDNDEGQLEVINNTWSSTNLTPGLGIPEKNIEVYNKGTLDADHLDIAFSYTGDEDIARNLIFTSANNGFRFGGITDGDSVNLLTALKGGTDVDYIVTNGNDGQPLTASSVDGLDGNPKDGKISLYELAQFGKIRIQPADETKGIAAKSSSNLRVNMYVDEQLSSQNSSLNMKITFNLDQDAGQF